MQGWSIPDWAGVLGFLWAVIATIWGAWVSYRKHQSESLTHRFLVGLKPNLTATQQKAVNDELERIKPSRKS